MAAARVRERQRARQVVSFKSSLSSIFVMHRVLRTRASSAIVFFFVVVNLRHSNMRYFCVC